MVRACDSQPVGAEQRLKALGIDLPAPPTPFGTYVEAVQAGNLLFLTGMLPLKGRDPQYIGKLGKDLDVEEGREDTRMAALNTLAVARMHLGSLDKVKRIVRTSIFMAVSGDFPDQPKVADGASCELFRDVFGADGLSVRTVVGVASLPLNMPVEVEITLEVTL